MRSRSRQRDRSRAQTRYTRSRGRHSGRAEHRESRCSERCVHSRSSQRRRSPRVQESQDRGTSQQLSPKPAATSPVIISTVSDNSVISNLLSALKDVGRDSGNERLSNLNAIPEFDPARKEQTITMWLHKVNECSVIYNWTERQTIHFALPKLKGLAQKWYEGLPTVLYSWQEWQEKLKLAFPSEENYGQLLTSMLAKRARFNDSLEEYFYEKVVMLNRCGISGKRAVDCVVFGIDDRSVRLGAEAARFESPDLLLPYLKSVKTNTTATTDRKRIRPNDVKSEFSSKDSAKDRVIRCFNCHQEGHYKSQCPKPPMKCDKCSMFGHTSDRCRTGSTVDQKNVKPIMTVDGDQSISSKYYKKALINDKEIDCFIDFGSTATMISRTAANSLALEWEPQHKGLPSLRGFGDAIVQPLDAITINLSVDGVSANVRVLIVPDEVMRVPLIIGQTFTEQPHIFVEKDCNRLTFISLDGEVVKVKLYCVSDVTINGTSLIDFRTDPLFSGDVYIESSNRFEFGKEYNLVQGLFTVVDGRGVALVEGNSEKPFVLKAGTLLARCRRATLDSDQSENRVLKVECTGNRHVEQSRPITESDVITDGTLTKDTLSTLVDLLNRYRNCFAFDLKELGKTDLVEMEIHLKTEEPVVYRPYRLPFSERGKVREMIQELLDCGIIRPSTSCYASPIVLVKKKTGDIRLCVDYRALNRKTVKENYPLPRIDDQLDDLAGFSFYTTLDLASGYYQIPIKEKYFSVFGIPKRLVSDRGSCFTSHKFSSYLDGLGVRHVLNAVATPRANGQVERYNRTLLDALTARCANVDEKKWDVHVPDIQLGLNNTINKGVGKSPAQVLFGLSLVGTTEGKVKLYLDNDQINDGETIKSIREKVNEYVADYQEKQKITHDLKAAIPKQFKHGDLVSIEREIPSTGQSKKLVPKFRGPYRVVAALGNDRYQVEDTPITRKGNRKYNSVVAIDKMKPWLCYDRSQIDASGSSEDDVDMSGD
ncbi:hypothetical protein ABMA27_015856 [Loxostege sticticalis]|uniref:Endonuclease n=1 Tax=Loxostege sticticalis TaxID=481309 RepID=A0ABR3I4M3_LOXSC